jgi:predicted SnoaL-like aldol condensation-catalyzing enzyme
MAATDTTTAAAEFADFFGAGWAIGATDPERFFEHFGGRLTPDALMIQPLAAAVRGPEGLRALFAPLFDAIPDLRGDVVRWGETGDGVLIELRLHGALGGRPIEWTTVDRITLRDGRIAEREAHFDPLPLAAALLRRPRASVKLLPALLRRKETR